MCNQIKAKFIKHKLFIFTDTGWTTLDTFTESKDNLNQSTLVINRIFLEDEGEYRCISGNGIDQDLIKQVTLTIKGDNVSKAKALSNK